METNLVDVLKSINNERYQKSSDPTTIADCAKRMLSTDFLEVDGAHRNAGAFVFLQLAGVAAASTAWAQLKWS